MSISSKLFEYLIVAIGDDRQAMELKKVLDTEDAKTLQSRKVSSAVPADNEVLKWNDTLKQWQPASDGGAPTGNADALTYFNGDGNLSSNTSAKFSGSTNSIAINGPGDAGTVSATAVASRAVGSTGASATIEATGPGSHAYGYSVSGSAVRSTGFGSQAFGSASFFSEIKADSPGAMASGSVGSTGKILAEDNGAYAHGFATGASSEIVADWHGAQASGLAESGGVIGGQHRGAKAFGHANGAGSAVIANAPGSQAHGEAISGFSITASGVGSQAHGQATLGPHTSSGRASEVQGDSCQASGDLSSARGEFLNNQSYAAQLIGRFGELVETPNSWVPEEAAWALANGADQFTPNIGYRLDKDGKITTSAAQRHGVESGDTTINASARTSRTIFIDSAAAATTVNLPPGENGLELFLKDIGGNTTTNPITVTPDGTDAMDPSSSPIGDRESRHLQFFNGTWWIIASYTP